MVSKYNRGYTQKEKDYLERIIHIVPRKELPIKLNAYLRKIGEEERTYKSVLGYCERTYGSIKATEDNLSAAAFSRFLGLSEYRISNWIHRGLFVPKKLGKNYCISLKTFREFGIQHPLLVCDIDDDILWFLYEDEQIISFIVAYRDRKKYHQTYRQGISVRNKFTGVVYDSISKASKATGLARSSIRYWIKKKEIWEEVN